MHLHILVLVPMLNSGILIKVLVKMRRGIWSSMLSIHFCNTGQIHSVVMVRSFSALCWLVLKEYFISSSIGNNIVLGVFRTGVSLYHGTHLDTIPTESDWIVTNPENSIIFCCGVDGIFWHLTLVAMRPLKVLYYTIRKLGSCWYDSVELASLCQPVE